MALADGEPVEAARLPTVTIAPGVTATIGWGRGAPSSERDRHAPGSGLPAHAERGLIVIAQEGSATIEFDGKAAELTKDHVLYLQPGSVRSLKAGAAGWKAFEVYSPVRLDHLRLAGQDTSAANAAFADQGVTPSLPSGVVVNVNEIQWTPLTDPVPGKPYRRSTANARLIWGKNAQISLVRMDPGSTIGLHIHPEDQLTHTVRGTLEQGVMDRTYPASGQAGHVVYLPGGMVHSAKLGEVGADQLDVFWPVRPDYVDRERKQRALSAQIIAPDARPQKLVRRGIVRGRPDVVEGQAVLLGHVLSEPCGQ